MAFTRDVYGNRYQTQQSKTPPLSHALFSQNVAMDEIQRA
jgi:hypothetical protein